MHTLMTVSLIVLEFILVVALADFLAGVIHWLEDAYFTEDTPVIGPLFIRANIVHHHFPRYFTRLSWWQSSWDLALAGCLILLIAWPLGLFGWQLALFVALSINANEVHKWSHRTRVENGRLISTLQDCHVLQTPRHHGLHHSDPKNTYYCPITNLVNPVLERVNFWDRLEAIIEQLNRRHVIAPTPRYAARVRDPRGLVAYRPVPKQACAHNCASCIKRGGNQPCQGARPAPAKPKSSPVEGIILSGLIHENS